MPDFEAPIPGPALPPSPPPLRLSPSDISAIASSVNRDLLRSFTALRGTSKPAPSRKRREAALAHANAALEDALLFGRHDLAAKAQLHRGHAFAALGMWRVAHGCFVRAASALVLEGGGELEALTAACRREMEAEDRARRAAAARESLRVHCGAGTVDEEALLRGEALDWNLLRDGAGRIVEIVDGRPALRRVKGRVGAE